MMYKVTTRQEWCALVFGCNVCHVVTIWSTTTTWSSVWRPWFIYRSCNYLYILRQDGTEIIVKAYEYVVQWSTDSWGVLMDSEGNDGYSNQRLSRWNWGYWYVEHEYLDLRDCRLGRWDDISGMSLARRLVNPEGAIMLRTGEILSIQQADEQGEKFALKMVFPDRYPIECPVVSPLCSPFMLSNPRMEPNEVGDICV